MLCIPFSSFFVVAQRNRSVPAAAESKAPASGSVAPVFIIEVAAADEAETAAAEGSVGGAPAVS